MFRLLTVNGIMDDISCLRFETRFRAANRTKYSGCSNKLKKHVVCMLSNLALIFPLTHAQLRCGSSFGAEILIFAQRNILVTI